MEPHRGLGRGRQWRIRESGVEVIEKEWAEM
jgi:hypothetical protein